MYTSMCIYSVYIHWDSMCFIPLRTESIRRRDGGCSSISNVGRTHAKHKVCIYNCYMCWTCICRYVESFSSWCLTLSCTLYVSMYGTTITCSGLRKTNACNFIVPAEWSDSNSGLFRHITSFSFHKLYWISPAECCLCSPAAFIQSPPSVSFWDLWGEWFSSANKLLFLIEFLSRTSLSVVIKQPKMTQSAGGPASGKMLSISCQQWPLGLPSHGTGKQGIVSSWVWLRDHTGPIVSSSLGSYCSSVSGKGRAFTSVVC